MRCPRCKLPIIRGFPYCPHCGKRLTSSRFPIYMHVSQLIPPRAYTRAYRLRATRGKLYTAWPYVSARTRAYTR
jgi:hypothetical protein